MSFSENLSNAEVFVRVFERMRRNQRKVLPLLTEFCERNSTKKGIA